MNIIFFVLKIESGEVSVEEVDINTTDDELIKEGET